MSRQQQKWRKRLTLVRLEDRAVPANLIWTGAVDDHWDTNSFGTTNWAFNLTPHNGDSLTFPSSSQHHTNFNDLAGLTINTITVQYTPFYFSGNPITLTGNFLESGGLASECGYGLLTTMSAGTHTFTISPGANLVHATRFFETGGAAGFTKDGSGILELDGSASNAYTGPTIVNAGTLQLDALGNAVPGNLVINGARVVEDAADQIADTSAITVNSGGMLDLNSQTDTVGPVHIASGGTLKIVDSLQEIQGRLTTSSLQIDSGTNLFMKIGEQVPPDLIEVEGPVQVGGALHLIEESPVPIGFAITLIFNDGADPVVGTFDGLPQGAIVAADNGDLFTIDYAGGTGNDVVVTRRPSLQVTSTQINDGSAQRSRVTSLTVTFNAPVTFSITAGTAFTLVRNSDGAIEQFTATAAVMGGVTVVTLNNFGGDAAQFGSLADGRYTLTALASQITVAGQRLDGNGDGISGDDYVFGNSQGLYRFFGDVNGDRTVNGLDFGFFKNAFGTQVSDPNYLRFFDFNGDGVINGFDFGQFKLRFGTTLP
jgi:autotransporter-associated beta strand protein